MFSGGNNLISIVIRVQLVLVVVALITLFIFFKSESSAVSDSFGAGTSFYQDPLDEDAYFEDFYRLNFGSYGDLENERVYVDTPERMKAVYMTANYASSRHKEKLLKMVYDTPVNAIVIDVKDYTGNLLVPYDDNYGFGEAVGGYDDAVVIEDIEDLLGELGDAGIYRIARVAVFQDPKYALYNPDEAVWTLDGEVWKDRKGLSWVDADSESFRNYIAELCKYAYDLGFDEINLDYIRFPSDGNMSDIYFPVSGEKRRADVMESFYAFISEELKGHNENMVLSADLFGLTTSASGDLGIGQKLEDAIKYFDYIYPMIYPSHYGSGFAGFANPVAHPYEVVYRALLDAKKVANGDFLKIRPWLQDFDLGVKYGEKELIEQVSAVYDAGYDSWLMWDPSNRYTGSFFYGEWLRGVDGDGDAVKALAD